MRNGRYLARGQCFIVMASRKDKEALARLCEGYVDDLTTFKTEVLKLLDKTSVTERRPSFVRVKAILGRRTAFRLLDDDLLDSWT